EESRRPLVDMHPDPQVRMVGAQESQRRRARAGAQAHVPDARPRQLVHERPDERVRRLLHVHRLASNAASIGRSFSADSSYSLSGTESPMMPQPANSHASSPRTRAERKPAANSPSPAQSIQPTGPAYQPRAQPSRSRI